MSTTIARNVQNPGKEALVVRFGEEMFDLDKKSEMKSFNALCLFFRGPRNVMVECKFVDVYQMILPPDTIREWVDKALSMIDDIKIDKLGDRYELTLHLYQADTGEELNQTLLTHFPDRLISMAPKKDCPECHGTGKYVGFNKVEVCRTCS